MNNRMCKYCYYCSKCLNSSKCLNCRDNSNFISERDYKKIQRLLKKAHKSLNKHLSLKDILELE
ncbi:hypothetical protein ES702_02983 [subsurface metagenome]